jgi:hypothetical protein
MTYIFERLTALDRTIILFDEVEGESTPFVSA